MPPLPPVDVLPLFAGERAALLDLLAGLADAEWAAPTACPAWSVKDVALHLLGDDVGRLSGGRDAFDNSTFGRNVDLSNWSGLVAAIDHQNAVWVDATRRLSPRLLLELLRFTSTATERYFRDLDLVAFGGPVDWAGPEPAPVWLDVAREYTERWVHQQHIRDAVDRPGLTERCWFAPVLETFARALPLSLRHADAPVGALVRLVIRGEAGGTWQAEAATDGWRLRWATEAPAAATVTIDQNLAWRLFTRGVDPREVERLITLEGDRALGRRVLRMVSILA